MNHRKRGFKAVPNLLGSSAVTGWLRISGRSRRCRNCCRWELKRVCWKRTLVQLETRVDGYKLRQSKGFHLGSILKLRLLFKIQAFSGTPNNKLLFLQPKQAFFVQNLLAQHLKWYRHHWCTFPMTFLGWNCTQVTTVNTKASFWTDQQAQSFFSDRRTLF